MSTLITMTNVNKSFGNKQVLKDINLQVKAGQILGLVGANGAGKSTCLQALLGLSAFEGDINVLGHQPNKDRTKMLNDVAYISDVAVLPKWITVKQLIEYMTNVHAKFDVEKAMFFLSKTNITLKDKVKTLSKGMVTQLHLSLILAIDAKVLILDEPTLGLDILTRQTFYQHLLEEFYTEDKCIIVTTHQIEEIENILTDVAFIKNGEIVLSQSIEQVKNRFKLLSVSNENKERAMALEPINTHSMMGLTTMLFDQKDAELEGLGQVSTPSLADVFVGIMKQEVSA